jgi:hypothetical protein
VNNGSLVRSGWDTRVHGQSADGFGIVDELVVVGEVQTFEVGPPSGSGLSLVVVE